MFDLFYIMDIVPNRGTCVRKHTASRMAVFTRVDRFNRRVFDVVSYGPNDHAEGSHMGTKYSIAEAMRCIQWHS